MLLGKAGRAKKGLFHGGKHLPIGYDRVDGKLVINEYEAVQIRLIYDLYLAGKGLPYINKYMHENYRHRQGDWKHVKSISHVLDNNVYIGTIKFKDEEIPNSHEPIISEEKFYAVQKLRSNKRVTVPRSNSLLTGFIYCGICGSRMFFQTSQTHQSYYCCHSATGSNLTMIKDPDCNMPWIRHRLLEARVDYSIRSLVFDHSELQKLAKKPKKKQSNADAINRRISEINKETEKLMELYSLENMPAQIVAEKIAAIQNEKKTLESQLTITRESSDDNTAEITQLISNTAAIWDLADTEQKRFLMKTLVRKITVYPDNIEIEWTF